MTAITFADMSTIMDNAWPYVFGPIGAVLALIMAFVFSRGVMAQSEGDEGMIEVAEAVRQGAMAYLTRQYKVVAIVFVALVAILAVLGFAGIQPKLTAIGVPIAGLLSGLCGWFGMKMATNASARTTFAAKQSLNDGLKVAFRAGAVMGLVVVGFALLDVSVWFLLWNTVLASEGATLVSITTIMMTFGMALRRRHSSPASVAASTPKPQTSAPTWSAKSKRASLKTTRVTRQRDRRQRGRQRGRRRGHGC